MRSRTASDRARRAIALIAGLVALPAVALAAAPDNQLRSFATTGHGPGGVSPHAESVAVAADGHVFVADTKDNRVERFDAGGDWDGGWPAPAPSGVAIDPSGRVLVATPHGVSAHTQDGALLDRFEPMGPAGGVGVGAAGLIYASDRGAGTVVAFSPSGERVGTFGDLVQPGGIAVGPDGTVAVADAGAGRVHVFPSGGDETSFEAQTPSSVVVGAEGEIYVAERWAHSIGVYGADGTRRGTIGDDELTQPRGVALDCRGALYAVDTSALRMHVFAADGTAPPPCDVRVAPAPPPTVVPTPPPPQVAVPQPVAPEEENPVIGQTTRASTVAGQVFVGKGKRKRRLGARQIVPIGETFDTSGGRVQLEFETTGAADRAAFGRYMDGTFFDGEFAVHQSRTDSLVELHLADADVDASKARASATRKRRRLWSRSRGRFRTVGHHGAATVRGTRWLTEERDAGTYFRVTDGRVRVREFATGETRDLGPGDTFLARPECLSRRRFRIRLRIPVGTSVRAVSVRVRGRRVPVRRGSRLTAVVDLRGTPAARVEVRITVRAAGGRVITGTRSYRTCERRRSGGAPPEL